MRYLTTPLAVLAMAGLASAQTFDGNITPAEWGAPLSVQTSPTSFGDATGGGQDSAGGGELNAVYGTISGGTLNFAITGNIEGNFNKFWIFIDAVDGGEQTLQGDNVDGGFGEILNLTGTTFDAGFEPDHGIRVEVGSGFFGINAFDLIDNTAGSITSGGGPGDLPIAGAVGGFGTTVGWDNSNVAGVTSSDGSTALTATQGLEFSIDMLAFFGEIASEVRLTAFYGDGGATFISNQVAGASVADNLAGSPDFTAFEGEQFVTIIPTPGAAAMLGMAGLVGIRRRR